MVFTNLNYIADERRCAFNSTDITERIRRNWESARSTPTWNDGFGNALATRSRNKELESFSYSVSHRSAGPLRHIDGYVEMLIKHAATPLATSRGVICKIVSELRGSNAGKLIDDLLPRFPRMGERRCCG